MDTDYFILKETLMLKMHKSSFMLAILTIIGLSLIISPVPVTRATGTPAYTVAELSLGGESYAYFDHVSGQIVGYSDTSSGGNHAFLYDTTGLHDLSLGGAYSSIAKINAAGQIIGRSRTSGGQNHAFLYSGGTMTELSLGGSNSIAKDITSSGVVIGEAEDSNADSYAFVYNSTGMHQLSLGGTASNVKDTNASGQVVGQALTSTGADHSYLYSGGTVTDLGTLGGSFTHAEYINASGQITGSSQNADGEEHAFLYDGGTMTDLGTLGGVLSFASGINALGDVIGQSDTSGATARLAFVYNSTGMHELSLGGNVSNTMILTDAGQVLGDAETTATDPDTSSPIRHAFLYNSTGMHELSFGGGNSDGYGINSSGQVIGRSYKVDGTSHAFLYSSGTLNDMGTLSGPNSSADNFTASGKITGSSQTVVVDGYEDVYHSHSFMYSSSTMTDISLGYTASDSYILMVNSSDDVLGYEYTSGGDERAFVYDGTGAHELLLSGSYSFPGYINGAGQAVGSSEITGGAIHALVFGDGVTQDLNDLIDSNSGWELSTGDDISDAGLIIGTGNSVNGDYRAFLLTPTTTP
jgi:probable HAF family extracellular repeat protein